MLATFLCTLPSTCTIFNRRQHFKSVSPFSSIGRPRILIFAAWALQNSSSSVTIQQLVHWVVDCVRGWHWLACHGVEGSSRGEHGRIGTTTIESCNVIEKARHPQAGEGVPPAPGSSQGVPIFRKQKITRWIANWWEFPLFPKLL